MIKSIDEPFQKVFDITTKLTTIQVKLKTKTLGFFSFIFLGGCFFKKLYRKRFRRN